MMQVVKPSMATNAAGREIIKDSEGLRLSAYLCPAGIPTVGWGHTGQDVQMGMTISKDDAERLLDADLAVFERGVSKVVSVPLTANQFSALVSFSFNVGLGNLKSSTLLRKLNSGDYEGAAAEFTKWSKANGQTLAGLYARRLKEQALFLHDDEVS